MLLGLPVGGSGISEVLAVCSLPLWRLPHRALGWQGPGRQCGSVLVFGEAERLLPVCSNFSVVQTFLAVRAAKLGRRGWRAGNHLRQTISFL